MTNYGFIAADGDVHEATTEQSEVDDKWNWGIGDHTSASGDEKNALSEAIGTTMDDIDGDLDAELMGVLEDAQDLVASTNITRFECPLADCGLGHSHPDTKHDIRSHHESSGIPGFNITDEFAEQMEFCPFCHCGANEAAMLVAFFQYFTEPMFKDNEEFEGVDEVEPAVLEEMYRLTTNGPENGNPVTLNRAAAIVANNHNADESELVPLGVRDDIKAFFSRRRQMEQQAQKAPIAQETRAVIEQNREELEEATSE